ncbi:MAG: uroporphyrinogen-III synthase [Gammaproteobacteria bacterium]
MKPLAGQSVLLTRTAEDCAQWARELDAVDATAVILPCIRCESLDTEEVRELIAIELPRTDWLVFTSRRGVEAFCALYDASFDKSPLPEQVKVAAVGAATADAAVVRFGHADLVSEQGTAASLAQALDARLTDPGARLLIAVAENAGRTLEDVLEPAGAICTRLDVYRTVPAREIEPKHALSALGADNIFLASPSAVTGFTNQVELDRPAAVFTIGPATYDAAEAAGLTVTGQARRPSLEGLMEAMRCAS